MVPASPHRRAARLTEGLVVLVVESDPTLREQLGEWLETEQFVELSCPGPLPPDYSCVGSREGICSLVGPSRVSR